jgi:hypothetical protein
MSYTDRNKAIDNMMEKNKNKYRKKEPWEKKRDVMELKRHAKPNVSNLVELASNKVITPMDGRDQARIDTIEAKGKVKVYTVSLQEDHHLDKTRHCNSDFCGRFFINDLKELCGNYSLAQVRNNLR